MAAAPRPPLGSTEVQLKLESRVRTGSALVAATDAIGRVARSWSAANVCRTFARVSAPQLTEWNRNRLYDALQALGDLVRHGS